VEKQSPALFLDRDGVINEDFGYVHRPEDTVFIPGIFELVRTANMAGYKVIVVTNQAGIGRGYYSESDFHEYMDWQRNEFLRRDAVVDAIYFCPHHPDFGLGKYKRKCDCRKPMPGLINKAAREMDINLRLSLLVGDKMTDIYSGVSARVGTLGLLNREPSSLEHDSLVHLPTLHEAIRLIE
jgi:D-glycero-D-manno-heptose 1,7-bisphosphate phosphatase